MLLLNLCASVEKMRLMAVILGSLGMGGKGPRHHQGKAYIGLFFCGLILLPLAASFPFNSRPFPRFPPPRSRSPSHPGSARFFSLFTGGQTLGLDEISRRRNGILQLLCLFSMSFEWRGRRRCKGDIKRERRDWPCDHDELTS